MWRSRRGMYNILLCDVNEIIFIHQEVFARALSLSLSLSLFLKPRY